MDAASKALLVCQASPRIVEQQETHRTSVPTETFSRMWSLVPGCTHLIVGLFAVFYLVAALTLAGELLFFTFAR
jgi:hypothetical protein